MHERKLPEHYRRAIRQCIGVGLPCFLAYGMVISENWKYHRQFSQGCLWSAITAALTSMPVIGKVKLAIGTGTAPVQSLCRALKRNRLPMNLCGGAKIMMWLQNVMLAACP